MTMVIFAFKWKHQGANPSWPNFTSKHMLQIIFVVAQTIKNQNSFFFAVFLCFIFWELIHSVCYCSVNSNQVLPIFYSFSIFGTLFSRKKKLDNIGSIRYRYNIFSSYNFMSSGLNDIYASQINESTFSILMRKETNETISSLN